MSVKDVVRIPILLMISDRHMLYSWLRNVAARYLCEIEGCFPNSKRLMVYCFEFQLFVKCLTVDEMLTSEKGHVRYLGRRLLEDKQMHTEHLATYKKWQRRENHG